MNKAQIVISIVKIATDFNKMGNISINSLLEESGLKKFHGQILLKDLENELKANKALIRSWFEYSENKRSDGWCITNDGDLYIVSKLNDIGTELESETFRDVAQACACFIHK